MRVRSKSREHEGSKEQSRYLKGDGAERKGKVGKIKQRILAVAIRRTVRGVTVSKTKQKA